MARNYRLPKNYKEDDIKYSVRDLSFPKGTTFMQCLNVPIYGEELIPHDKFRIKFATLLQSNALQTPLFGRYKLRVSTFNCPLPNYYGWMDNNTKLTAEELDAMPKWTISPAVRSFEFFGPEASVPFYGPTARDLVFASVLPVSNSLVSSDTMDDSVSPFYTFTKKDGSIREVSVQPGSFLDFMGFPTRYIYLAQDMILNQETFYPGDNLSYLYTSETYEDSRSTPLFGSVGWSFNAHFIFAYLDTVRSFLVNNQLKYVPYIYRTPNVLLENVPSITGTGAVDLGDGEMQTAVMPLESLDKFFIWLRSKNEPGDLLVTLWNDWIKQFPSISDNGNPDLDVVWIKDIALWLQRIKFGGLFCCQYEADMMQNLLTDVEGAEAFVEIVNGQFSVNEFRLANRKQRRRERVAISGGRYKDVIRVLWDAKSRTSVDIPDFINTSSFEIDPRNIVSTSDTELPDASGKALGQMAGNVNQFKQGKYAHKVKTQDPSFVIMIASLVPEVMYSDGIDKNLLSTRFSDDYSPQFDQVGFQDVPNLVYSARPVYGTTYYNSIRADTVRTVGKNVAWIRYISNVGRVHGDFSRGEVFDSYVLSRPYAPRTDTNDVVQFDTVESQPNGYAIPMDYQYPFIIQKSDYRNWFFQIDLDIRATRAIGKNYMPTLGK